MIGVRAYLRFLSKHKRLTVINLVGLSIGISTCIFIGLYVADELSYDKYHKNVDRTFAITTTIVTDGSFDHIGTTTLPLALELKQNYPEVEDAVRLKPLLHASVKYQTTFLKENEIFEADPNIFRVFTYPLLKGDPETALSGPDKIVVTESFASRYFNEEDPINKTINVNKKDYLVTGVMKDIPSQSDLKFSALISLDRTNEGDWFNDFEYHTYVLLKEEYISKSGNVPLFEKKLEQITQQKLNIINQAIRFGLFLQPLNTLHFRKPLLGDTPKANLDYILIIASVAILILLITSLNFINFSLVQSLERGKEVGIRKVIGAKFHQLVFRYLSESLVITLCALIIAFFIVIILTPVFNDIAGKNFKLHDVLNYKTLLSALTVMIVVGILAGSFPAFFTSSINPLQSLKGKMTGVKGIWLRKTSIVAQFAITIGLIICTMLIHQQMDFIADYNLGFRKNNIVIIDTPADSLLSSKLKLFKQSILKNEKVERASNLGFGALISEGPNKGDVKMKANGEPKIMWFSVVDEDYLPALNIEIKEGRNFDALRIHDKQQTVIVNESFIKAWGIKDPLEETVSWQGRDLEIIGVVKDFNFLSLHKPIEPLMLLYNDKRITNTLVSFKNDIAVSDQISFLKSEWEKYFSDDPFVYRFMDESLATRYRSEGKALTLFTAFSIVTIATSCLGLFGLCSLTIAQRKKEVGLRKVMGATLGSIVSLFSKEYLSMIVLSFLIVAPLCWFIMTRWLESFLIKEKINLVIFVIAGIAVASLGLIIIISSIAKTSNTNASVLIRD